MEDNCSTRPLALGDIFLDVLEQMSNDESQKTYVRKVKILVDVPECAEFLSICLINAMGYPMPIAASTIDKAVDCLSHFYEDNIEGNEEWTKEQKNEQKGLMHGFMKEYRQAVKTFATSRNLVI